MAGAAIALTLQQRQSNERLHGRQVHTPARLPVFVIETDRMRRVHFGSIPGSSLREF
jgi:hypothetical protein